MWVAVAIHLNAEIPLKIWPIERILCPVKVVSKLFKFDQTCKMYNQRIILQIFHLEPRVHTNCVFKVKEQNIVNFNVRKMDC